jgi:hypothetical protein
MKMTNTESRFEATDDALAKLGQRLDAAEARYADLAEKMDSVFRLLGGWLDQHAKQVMDTQTTMINARMPERQAKGGGAPTAAPVKFGSTTPYDAQVWRIDAKRRELLGKK